MISTTYKIGVHPVTCGTSPRGRVADLTISAFVDLGGDLDRGCFNATITIGG
jgi:hypothetical protein